MVSGRPVGDDVSMPDHATDQFQDPPVEGPIEATSNAGESDRPLHRPLQRSEEGRWLLGVCTAIRDTTGWPVWIPRLAFVVLAPVFGLGVLAYLILAVTVPHRDDGRSIAGRIADGIDRPTQWLGAAAAIVGGMLLLGVATGIRREAIVALGLIAAGVLLFQVRPPAERPAPPPRPRRPARVRHDFDDVPAERPVREPRPPRPPRERSPLAALTIAACLLVLAVMSALHLGGLVAISWVHYLAAATITVAVGLLVGARWGRSRLLVVLALGLLPFTGVAFMLDNAADAAEYFFGVDSVEEITVTGAPADVRRNAARLRLDLTGVDWQRRDGNPTQMLVGADIGDVALVLPPDVIVSGWVGFGSVEAPGRRVERGTDVQVWAPGPDWESATGLVHVGVGWGRVTIERSGS